VGQIPFSFIEWYMDCVTDLGDALVLSCVEMRWQGVYAVHSNVLALHGGQKASHSTMARHHLYKKGDQVIVEIPRLDLSEVVTKSNFTFSERQRYSFFPPRLFIG